MFRVFVHLKPDSHMFFLERQENVLDFEDGKRGGVGGDEDEAFGKRGPLEIARTLSSCI
jgi:hypothetical protein